MMQHGWESGQDHHYYYYYHYYSCKQIQDVSSAFFLERKGSNTPVAVCFELLNEFTKFLEKTFNTSFRK